MKKTNQKKISFFVGVIIILFVLHFFGVLNPVEKHIVNFVSVPVNRVYSFVVSKKKLYSEDSQINELKRRVETLESKNQRLIAENVELKYLEEENKNLREHLDFAENEKYENILARVISTGALVNPEEKTHSLIINKGSDNGIREGLLVVNSNGVVVGKIIDVKSSSAKINLITHNSCKVASTIQNESETYGVVEGDLGLTMKMKFIPQSVKLESEDYVVTSGLEKNVPAGMVLGKVIEVEKSSNQMWQEAVIEPLVDLKDLTMVSVLVP